MTSYTRTFGNKGVAQACVGFYNLALDQDTELVWSVVNNGEVPWAAQLDVTPDAAGRVLTFPDATQASVGTAALVANLGADVFTINDASGSVITTINAGAVKHIYLRTNATAAGTWGVVLFGAAASALSAADVDGAGLRADGSELVQTMAVASQNANYTITEADRATLLRNTGGAVTFAFDPVATLGNDFFVVVRNDGSGDLTLDPNASELVDGATTLVLAPTESAVVACDGAAFYTIGMGQSTVFAYESAVISNVGSDITLSSAQYSKEYLRFEAGVGAADIDVTFPATFGIWFIDNVSGFSLTLKSTGAGATVSVPSGIQYVIVCDGAGTPNIKVAHTMSATSVSSFPQGTEATPSINFTGDSDTGIYSPAVDEFAVAIAGTKRFHLTATTAEIVNVLEAMGFLAHRDSANSMLSLYSHGTKTSGAPIIAGYKSNGTEVAPTATENDSVLLAERGYSYGGSTWFQSSLIEHLTTELQSETARGSKIQFRATQPGTTTLSIAGHVDYQGFKNSAGTLYALSGTNTDITKLAGIANPAGGIGIDGYRTGNLYMQWTGYTNAAVIRFRRAEGTNAAPTKTLDATLLGQIEFQGYNGTDFSTSAFIRAIASGDWSGTNEGSYIDVFTCAQDETVEQRVWRWNSAGNFVAYFDGTVNGNLAVVGTLDVNALTIAGEPVRAGAGTIAVSNVAAGISGLVVESLYYIQVEDYVVFGGRFYCSVAEANTTYTFELDPPVAGTFGNAYQAHGTITTGDGEGYGRVYTSAANDTLILSFQSTEGAIAWPTQPKSTYGFTGIMIVV